MRTSIISAEPPRVKPEHMLEQIAAYLRHLLLDNDLQAPYIRAALDCIECDLRDLADRRYRPAVLARWRGRMN